MKFTEEKMFEIATEEYEAAGLTATPEGAGTWAMESAEQDYKDEAEVRAELAGYIKEEQDNA